MRARYKILLLGDNEEDKKLYAEKFFNVIKWEEGWSLEWSPQNRCICSMNYE